MVATRCKTHSDLNAMVSATCLPFRLVEQRLRDMEQLYKNSPSNLPNIFNNPQVDAGLHSIITNLEATQPAWDSSLCPTARSSETYLTGSCW